MKLWDAASGQELHTLKGHISHVYCVVFSPDGLRLASSSEDQTVKLWDVVSGQELRTLKGHTRAVTTVAFSPDGQRLASAGHDQTVRLWDAPRRLSDEWRVDREARGLFEFLLEYRKLSKTDAVESIKANRKISEAVWARALEFARQWK